MHIGFLTSDGNQYEETAFSNNIRCHKFQRFFTPLLYGKK